MTTAVIIQARLGSSRFPRKVLAPIYGQPLLGRVVARCRTIAGVDRVEVAIPDDEPELAVWIRAHLGQVPLLGHPTDVLARYEQAAAQIKADVIMRITGDCPLICPDAAGEVLERFRKADVDYATNDGPDVDGLEVQVFSRDVLHASHLYAHEPDEREHVCPWMAHAGGVHSSRVTGHGVGWALSVNLPEDVGAVDLVHSGATALGFAQDFGLPELRRVIGTLEGLLPTRLRLPA